MTDEVSAVQEAAEEAIEAVAEPEEEDAVPAETDPAQEPEASEPTPEPDPDPPPAGEKSNDGGTEPKFKIKKAAFLNALEKASATVSTKDNDPLLKSFNIESEGQREVRILSTDMSLGSVARIRVAQVEQAGAICVPAAKLVSIIRAAEEGDIEFSIEGNHAVIKAGRARWQVNVLDAEEYPAVPRFNDEDSEQVDREKLLDVIQKVRYAASQDEVRPMLMLIAFNGERAATSDGYRLQVADFKGLEGVQIPIFAVSNLVKLLTKSEQATIKVDQQENHLLFQIGPDTYSTQRLYEEFPDVETKILSPAEGNEQKLTVDKEQLGEAIKRVRIAADEDRRQLDIQVLEAEGDASPTEIQISAQDPEGELATEILACSTTLAPGRIIQVNHSFFTDALEMSPAKQVTLRLGEDGKQRRSSIYMKEKGLKSVLLQLRPEE